jgi:hypothetical protein
VLPAAGALVLAVLVIAKSATGETVTVAVELLLPGVGSVVPAGGVTVATLAKAPLALAAAVTWNVMVTRPNGGIVVEPIKLLPVATKLAVLAPALAWLVTPVKVPRPAGRVSAKLAPVAVLGPALPMTMV